jgi:hypothetical protein
VTFSFRLRPGGPAALRDLFEGSLKRRRAFVANLDELPPPEAASLREACRLFVVVPDGGEIEFEAEIVFVQHENPGRGVGLTLTATDLEAALKPLADSCAPLDNSLVPSFELVPAEGSVGVESVRVCLAAPDSTQPTRGGQADDAPEEGRGDRPGRVPNIHERVRKLTAPQRDKMARTAGLTERVALERAFGGAVWEALLQNPQLTAGEVSRIAKNGGAPTPLLGIISGNAAWLARGEVRRALLTNPRLGAGMIEKILQATPNPELKLVAKQALYPSRVRSVATRILRKG